MGWDETSLKHGGAFTSEGKLTCRSRCGLIWTFLVRWALTVLTLCAVWIGIPVSIVWPLTIENWGLYIELMGYLCFFGGMGPWVCATLEAIFQVGHRGRQSCIQVFFVFLVASPFGFTSFFAFSFPQ